MQIRILHHECCGSGGCIDIAPQVFALDSKNKAVVMDPEAETTEKVMEAAEACPSSAIVILDDDGNQVFP